MSAFNSTRAEANGATKKALGFFNKFIKRFFICVSVIAIFLALTAVGILYESQKPLALTNGEKLTKEKIEATQTKFEKFFKRNKQESTYAEAQKILLEERAIELEAQKRGIVVTDEQIADRLNNDAAGYSSLSDYLTYAEKEYGFSENDLRQRIKIDFLRAELKKVVLNSRNVEGYYFRWDVYGKNQALVERAKTELEEVRKDVVAGVAIEEIYGRYKNSNNWREPFSGKLIANELNGTTELKNFEGREEWQSIKNLNDTNRITEVIKSSGGYFAVYRLTSISNGGFDTWEQFVNSYLDSSNERISKIISKYAFVKNVYAICENAALFLSSGGTCCGLVDPSNAYHYAQLGGTIYDNLTKAGVPSVLVSLQETDNSSALCRSVIDDLGGPRRERYSGTGGVYSIPDINCWLNYSLTVTKTGYETYNHPTWWKPVNGKTETINIYIRPVVTHTVTLNPSGAGTVEAHWYRTDVGFIAPSLIATCTTSCTQTIRATALPYVIRYKVAPGTAHTFSHWILQSGASAPTTSTGTEINVNRLASWNITAVFNPINYTLSYNGNGSTSGTTPASSTHLKGSVATVAVNPGSLSKTGYSFAGWCLTIDAACSTVSHVTMDANKTVYAKWTRNPCIVDTFTVSQNKTEAPVEATFSFTLSNPDSYSINYGNGVSSAPNPVSPTKYTYTTGGVYTAVLACGASSKEVTVTVTNPNQPPSMLLIEPSPDAKIYTVGGTANVTLRATVDDPEKNQVDSRIWFKKDTDLGYSYINNGSNGWTGLKSLPFNPEVSLIGLTAGKYSWFGEVKDNPSSGVQGHTYSTIRYFTVIDPPTLGCKTTPDKGYAPLAVKIEALLSSTLVGTNTVFSFGDRTTTVTTTKNTVYHSYQSAGTYIVTISNNNGPVPLICTKTVTVKNPIENNGSEITP